MFGKLSDPDNVVYVPMLKFPVTTIMDIMSGKVVNLIQVRSPTLEIGVGFEFTYPLPPPVSMVQITFGGGMSLGMPVT